MKTVRHRRQIGLLSVAAWWVSWGLLSAQNLEPAPQTGLQPLLERMLAEDPGRADTWRLLGRIHRQQGRWQEAIDCFQQALQRQPENAAAHFDLGELLEQQGDPAGAHTHFQQVLALAPSSPYAQQLAERGLVPAPPVMPPANDFRAAVAATPVPLPNLVPNAAAPSASLPRSPGELSTVGYEIQTFDGSEELEDGLQNLDNEFAPEIRRWRAFVEFGALYNTNVSLTPISRELTKADAASYQGFLSPDVEWTAVSVGSWRTGPLLRGYFTLNEDAFQEFNLASFQPGAFVERDLGWWEQPVIGRVEYVYAIDLMNGDRFGDRHAVTASTIAILSESDVVYAYFTTSFSQFDDDGSDPSMNSLDGVAFTTGISRFFQTAWGRVPTWSLGADLEWADTEGSDYRYEAFTVHSDATIALTERLSFIPKVGIGYRHYGDFTGPISRDEVTYRVHGKLRWKWSDSFSVAAIVGYDRFASENEDFDSERTETGLVATFVY